MGHEHANQRNVLTLPLTQGAMDSGYSPDAPPFFRAPSWLTSPSAGHFAAFCGTASATRVRGGPGGTRGGAWVWKPLPGKPVSPIPEPILAGDLTRSKVFLGPPGALMRGSHWELLFLQWEERGWVKLQRSGRRLECIPQWEYILGQGV